MDQSNAVSDASAKNASLLNGLLSHMKDNAQSSNLFSNLLSQSDELKSSLDTLARNRAEAKTTPANNLSVAPFPDQSSKLMQTLHDLSSTLHKVLAVLRQQNNNTAPDNHAKQDASASTQTSPQTKNPAPTQDNTNSDTSSASGKAPDTTDTVTVDTSATSTPSPVSVTQPDDTAQIATTDAPPVDLQSLAEIIAQLLALTQALTKNLSQQPQTATGKTPTDLVTGQKITMGEQSSPAAALNAMGETNLPLTPSTATPSVTPITTEAAPAPADTQPQTLDDSVTAQLQKMLTDLQKTAQHLFPQENTTQDKPSAASTVPDVTTTLASLDAGLKNILTALQQQSQNILPTNAAPTNTITPTQPPASLPAEAPTPPLDLATKIIAAVKPSPSMPAATTSPETPQAAPADTANKPTPVPAGQSQIAPPINGISTTQVPAPAASGQNLSVNTAIIATSDRSNDNANTNANAGSDFFSEGKNTATFAPPETNASLNAEGAQAAGTYNFASTLSAARAINGGATGLPTPVEQVILQLNRSVKNGDDQISLQLHPADLGKITVKLDIGSDGKVQGSVTADNPQTLALLQKDSRSLERALQDAGLRTDAGSLQFNLGGQGGNNAGQTANNGKNNNGTGNGTVSASDMMELDLGTTAETYYLTPNGVNIRV